MDGLGYLDHSIATVIEWGYFETLLLPRGLNLQQQASWSMKFQIYLTNKKIFDYLE